MLDQPQDPWADPVGQMSLKAANEMLDGIARLEMFTAFPEFVPLLDALREEVWNHPASQRLWWSMLHTYERVYWLWFMRQGGPEPDPEATFTFRVNDEGVEVRAGCSNPGLLWCGQIIWTLNFVTQKARVYWGGSCSEEANPAIAEIILGKKQ